MKNMMLMTSKIATKNFKKIMSLVLILAILILPFVNLLNARAENATITVDDNKKVVETTGLTVISKDSSDINEDVLKAYKVLDAYYDKATNTMTYKFTSEFSTFLTTSGDTRLANLTIDDYMAYGSIDSNLSSTEQEKIQKEYNNMIESFAKYIKKGTNTLPKNYELTNSGTTKTATIEVGSYLILPAVLADKPYLYSGSPAYNYYSALIANAVYEAVNGFWILNNCNVNLKDNQNFFMNFIMDIPLNNLVESREQITEKNILQDREVYKDKEYTLYIAMSEVIYEHQSQELKITLPEGVALVDSTDINNVYTIDDALEWVNPSTADGKLYGKADSDGNQTLYGTAKVEDVTTNKEDGTSVTNKVITIVPSGVAIDAAVFGVRIKLSNDREKLVLGSDGNVINSSLTFTVDPYTDPATTKTLTSENKAITYGLEISNKSKSDSSYLTGATFGIYTSESCTDDTKVGEINVDETIDSQIVGRYVGLPSGTYYIKQLKAATGYKTATDIASITIETSSTAYVHLDVENAKQGLLPSTGGLGTIFYTLMGLLVVGAGAYSIIKYSKKQINS